MLTRKQVSERLATHYSNKMNGKVWSFYDTSKRAYCIQGEGLPAHPDLQSIYPNGWCLLDFVKPMKARKLVGR